jgi:3-oxoadipate enol-lactonase
MGEGPPLLLLPPLPGYKEAFLALAPRLARRFRVVTFDLRARFAGPPRWSALLDDLARIAEAFAPEDAVVLGHSLGGALALRWALWRPDRVRALVLSSAFARLWTPSRDLIRRYVEQPLVLAGLRWLPEPLAAPLARGLAARGRWVYDPRCDDAVVSLVLRAVRSVPVSQAVRCVRLARAHDLGGRLGAVAVPSLVVVGERESAFAHRAAAALSGAIPGAALAVSPGAAHLHPLSSPEWLAAAVTGWLERRGLVPRPS